MRAASLRLVLAAMTIATTNTPAQPAPTPPVPPVAKKVEKIHLLHGDARPDPYFWLRDKPNPEVAAYLEAENAYTDAVLKPTEPLQKALYDEMLSHVKETDLSVPYRDGAFLYYYRTEKGKQYRIHCRKARGDGAEQVLLDLNALAEGKKFMSLGAFRPSDDGSLLAYSTDDTGFRQYTLAVKDLKTGALLPERMLRVTSVAWAADGKTLFYTVEDETTKRSHRVYRHKVGTPASADALVLEEKDERFGVHVGRTRSRAWLVMEISSHTTSEARVLKADAPEGEWTLVAAREQDHEYDVDHRGDLFYIRTNSGGRNFRLVTAPVAAPGRANWKEIVPHRPDVMLTGIDLFKDHLVLEERTNGLPALHGAELHDRRLPHRRVPRARLRRVPRHEPRLGHEGVPVRLPVVRDAPVRLRLRHGRAPGEAAQGIRGAGLRPDAVLLGAPLGDGGGRNEDPALGRLALEDGRRQVEDAEGRAVPDAPLRLRLVRHLDRRVVPVRPAPAPRPRVRVRRRAHPRRRRDGEGLARRRAHEEQAQHVHGLHRGAASTSSPRRSPRRTASPPRAAAPAASSWAPS